MQTEISDYNATGYRDVLARLALQRANIMHLVDLKRGGYSPRRTEMRIGCLTARPSSSTRMRLLGPTGRRRWLVETARTGPDRLARPAIRRCFPGCGEHGNFARVAR